MSNAGKESGSRATRNKKTTASLRNWTIAWLATTAAAAFGPKLVWNFAALPTILFVLINVVVGLGMILAIRRHLLGLDELEQKIFLDAGALTLGVGLVFGLSYDLLEDIKLISFEPQIHHLGMLMCITFLVGMIAGHWKYR